MTRILLVDDDKAVVQVLASALDAAGYAVTCAGDGVEALARIRVEPPDLAITGIIMPRMDGLELIATVRRGGVRMPIIAISGGGRTKRFDFLALAERCGADAVLRKPVGIAALLAAIRSCLTEAPASTQATGGPSH